MWIWIPSLRTRRTLLLYDVAENCFLIRICTQPIFYWISNREIWYLGNIKIRYQGSYNLWNDCIKCRLVCFPLQIPKAFLNYKIISYWSRICGKYKYVYIFFSRKCLPFCHCLVLGCVYEQFHLLDRILPIYGSSRFHWSLDMETHWRLSLSIQLVNQQIFGR